MHWNSIINLLEFEKKTEISARFLPRLRLSTKQEIHDGFPEKKLQIFSSRLLNLNAFRMIFDYCGHSAAPNLLFAFIFSKTLTSRHTFFRLKSTLAN